jgi:hypothetical protein
MKIHFLGTLIFSACIYRQRQAAHGSSFLPMALPSQTLLLLRFVFPIVTVVLICLASLSAQAQSPSTAPQPTPSETVVANQEEKAALQKPRATATKPQVTSLPAVRVTLVAALLLGVLGSLSLAWSGARDSMQAWKGASLRSRIAIIAKGIGGLVLWMVIALRAFKIASPYYGPTVIDLDLSWQQVIEHAVTHGFSFGDQLVYTYGPLGFLTTFASWGGFVVERVLFAWTHATLAAYLAFRVGFLLPKRHRYLPWVWLALSPGTDVMLAALVGVALMSPPRTHALIAWLEVLGLAAFGAIMLNCKFTNVVAWSGVLGAVALYYLIGGQWKSALGRVVPFGAMGIAGWLFSGQPLNGLPVYVSNALKISKAYDTISMPAQPGMLFGGVASAAVLLLLSIAGLWASPRPERLRNLVKVLMVLGCAFISWKHGFVRADLGHVFLFLWMAVPYAILLFWACPIPAWLVSLHLSPSSTDGGGLRLFKIRLSTVAVVLVFAASFIPLQVYTGNLAYSLRISFSAQRSTFDTALSTLSPDYRLPRVDDLIPSLRNQANLPALSKIVGKKSVDVITNTQVWALANHMNYAPRPVFQGFAAGSPVLQKMNLEHYLSPTAKPRYALLHLTPIDNRHPWLEDAPLLLHLATHWKPIREEGGCVLFEEDPHARTGDWRKVKSSKSAPWGKWVKFASEPETMLSLKVETAGTAYGRLKRFLYQGSHCLITLRLDTGEEITNTFVPQLATEGFLLSPYFPSAGHIAEWRANPAFSSPHVVAFKLAPIAGCDAEFAPTFRYQLSAYKYKMKARPAAPAQ